MLFSLHFRQILADELYSQLGPPEAHRRIGAFLVRYQKYLTIPASVQVDASNKLSIEWLIHFLDQMNEVSKRQMFCDAVSILMSWSNTTQGSAFWYEVYQRVANGMELSWFSESDHVQLALQSFDGELLENLWDDSNQRNGVVFDDYQ